MGPRKMPVTFIDSKCDTFVRMTQSHEEMEILRVILSHFSNKKLIIKP